MSERKNTTIGTDLFTDDQLQLLKVTEKVLSKFKEATQTFSIDKSLSMPEVIPTIINLRGYMTRWLQNPPDFAIQGLCKAKPVYCLAGLRNFREGASNGSFLPSTLPWCPSQAL
jgi:hypothetical protein